MDDSIINSLAPMEVRVLDLLAGGFSKPEVMTKLSLTSTKLNGIITDSCFKLEVKKQETAAILWFEQKWTEEQRALARKRDALRMFGGFTQAFTTKEQKRSMCS